MSTYKKGSANMILFENGTSIANKGSVIASIRPMRGSMRDTLEIVVENTDYETVASLFTDGAKFSIVLPSGDTDGGFDVYDKSAFGIAGDIVDERDGSFRVFMGAMTEKEAMEEALSALVRSGAITEQDKNGVINAKAGE